MADGVDEDVEKQKADRRKSFRESTRKQSQTHSLGQSVKTPKRDVLQFLPDDDDDEKEHDSEEGEDIIRPMVLQDDTAVAGQEVFGFKTPKRAGSLAQAASEAIHVKTHKTPKIQGSSKKFSKTNLKKTPSAKKGTCVTSYEQPNTPKGKAKRVSKTRKSNDKGAKKDTSKTRNSSRRRPLPPSTSDSDDKESDSDDESVSSSDVNGFSGAAGTIASNLNKSSDADMSGILEEYFAVHQDTGARVTSDRTLSKLTTPRMDTQTLMAHMEHVPGTHGAETYRLYLKYRIYFSKWIFQLKNNFNLLLYGLGSKRTIIDQFRGELLKDSAQVVVNGFFPSLTIKNILNTITEELLGYEGTFKTVIDQCYYIKNSFSQGDEELYLFIHNIDGAMLRSRKAQTILSLLAEVPTIYVIATIDHINAPLIWDQTKCSRFNWLWYDVTTFEAYAEETSYENSLLVQQSGALALSSLTHVMRSLTDNAKGIFMLIAAHQLDEKDNSAYVGLSFHDCYSKCREKFLVNSELTLRAQLTEFTDHKLIKSKRGNDGVEYLYIPVDNATLKQFIEQQETENS